MSYPLLNILKPIVITPAMLVSTNVPETDYPEWAPDATYAEGARVIVAAQHKVYESVVSGNVGANPTVAVSPPKWAEVGVTNRWKPFDRSISSQVANPGSISYRLRLGRAVTAASALNLRGVLTVRLRLIDPSFGMVYDRTVDLAPKPVGSGWWLWFFGERVQPTQLLLQDLPSYPGADLVMDFTGTAELAVGVILVGQMRSFGVGVKAGGRLGISDYSRKERNQWGDLSFQERAYSRRATCSLLLPWREVDALHQFLSDVRATPCLWRTSRRHEAGTVYGIYKSFEILLPYTNYADCEIELEGLT